MKQNQWNIWEEELTAYPVWVRIVLIAVTSLIIILLVWEVWLGDIASSVSNLSDKNKQLENKIKRLNPKIYNAKIKRLERDILKLKSDEERSRYRLMHMKSIASKSRFLWFDENRFLTILKGVLEYSVKLGIRIDEIKSLKLSKTQKKDYVGLVKKVKMSGAGSFANIVKMIYYIESFNVLLEVSEVKIWLDSDNEELKFKLILTNYGITK